MIFCGRATTLVRPGRVDEVVAVVATDAVLTDRLAEALDAVPVQLEVRRHDEVVIGEPRTRARDDGVLLGAEFGHGVPDPGDSLRRAP